MTLVKKKKRASVGAESSTQVLPSEKKTPGSLKPRGKLVKKSHTNSAETKEVESTSQVQVGNKAKKKIIKRRKQESNNTEVGGKNLIPLQGNKEEKPVNKQSNETSKRESENEDKRKTVKGGIQESRKVEGGGGRNLILDQGNKEKRDNKNRRKELSKRSQKDESNIGGLIFMCNAKTKPDCFRYQVMGVATNKQEVVMGIKPGLKLFLYDFDLRLLYGIYKASSAGAMKLEPAAFGGAFPVQVRFKVHEDCLPLHENEFKHAIKENYNEKTHKFSVELTVQQVKKLTSLFRPSVWSHPNAQSPAQNPFPAPVILLPPATAASVEDAHREHFSRNHHSSTQVGRPRIPSNHDRNRFRKPPISTPDLASSDPLFLSEKEYRNFGLRPGRPGLTTVAAPGAAAFDPYGTSRERVHLRDMAFINEREHPREVPLILEREYPRDAPFREREHPRDAVLIREREHPRDHGRDYPQDREREYLRDREREYLRDREREYLRDREREHPRDREREHPRDGEREHPRDREREHPQDREREHLLDTALIREREHTRDSTLTREREHPRDTTLTREREHPRDTTLIREREHPRDATLIREREHPRDTTLIREREHPRDATLIRERETTHPDPLFLSEKDYRAYGLKNRRELPTSALATTDSTPVMSTYQKDPYYVYHDDTSSLVERYLPQPRTVVTPPQPYSSTRRDVYENYSERAAVEGLDRLYSTYSPRATSDYNHSNHHLGDGVRFIAAPVSSRYSFAGPSSAPYR